MNRSLGEHVIGEHIIGEHVIGEHIIGEHVISEHVIGDHLHILCSIHETYIFWFLFIKFCILYYAFT